MADVIIAVVIGGALFWIIRKKVKDAKSGKSGCGCSGCAGCGEARHCSER